MDAELKKKWVDALRSGEYQQGRHALRSGNGYCCLGVLCEVLGMEKYGTAMYMHDGYGIGLTIPSKMAAPLGLMNPCYKDAEMPIRDRLMGMNDNELKTFDQIADYIESVDF